MQTSNVWLKDVLNDLAVFCERNRLKATERLLHEAADSLVVQAQYDLRESADEKHK